MRRVTDELSHVGKVAVQPDKQNLYVPDHEEDSEYFDRGSTSGTAPEGGVLSMEELVVTERQDIFPEESSTKLTEDLSGTNMYTLPHYIFGLVALQKLILRSCAILMMELPPEIGQLTNLEVLDLEGTEILCLPKEIAKLVKLTCLKVSFYGYANQTVIPRRVLSNLSHLKELIIDVTPYGEWWDVEVEAIIDDLRNLKELTTLKLYLPTLELLKYVTSIFPNLANFRFTVGRQEEHFISRLPRDVEEEFNNREKLEQGLKLINGDCIPNEITKVLKHADAFFLQRHWTTESLSEFGHENLNEVKFFLVMECNEFRTIIDSEKLYQGKDGSAESEDFLGFDEAMALGSLERLIIRYMKTMESIWKGPVGKRSLSNLKSLALHTCPNLTTIFTIDMLSNLMNLEELIVEDCPKINSLVNFKDSGSESVPFLPSLKKISLLWLPGLFSISSGLEIALKLERMVIYYCPKLEKLSTAEVSSKELKVIKGEKEWWDALKWYESDVSTELENYLARLFIPLRRDGDLMAQLTEDEIAASGQGKVGSFKGLGTSTATTSTTINFRTELDSYEAACRLDRDLQTFDTTLQARTNQVITSVAAGVEVRALSFDSLKEVTECLLKMNQEVVKVLLECRQDIWNTPELYELVEEYFDNSLQTLDFCTALEKCLNRARASQLPFLVALEVFDEESGLEGGKGYVETLEELKKLKAAGDPFTDEFNKIFQDIYSHHTSKLDKLQTKKKKLKKKKLDKKLKTTQAWRRVSGIIFATTVAEVLICSVMATAIVAPPVAAALAAASAVPPGSMGTWIDSLWRKYEDAVKGQKDVVRSREMGTRFVIKDLDNIQQVIDRLEIQIESLLGNVDFVIEEKAVKIGIEEIKKKVEVFLKNVEDLRVQTGKCIRDVRRARTVAEAHKTLIMSKSKLL